MKKYIAYLAVAAIAISCMPFLSSCRIVKAKKNVNMISSQLDLKDFNKIEMVGTFDLEFSQGPYAVTLIMPEEVGNNVVTNVTDSLLKIEDTLRGSLNWQNRKIMLRVSAPDLSLLRINGAADVDIKNIDIPELYIESNGAGDVDIEDSRIVRNTITLNGAGKVETEKLRGETLTVNVNGSGKVDFNGEYQHAYINLSGASFADITELKCTDIHTTTSGAAKIEK